MLQSDRPGVEEAYVSAGNTSNLKVVAARPGDADVLIAAGWTESRVGMALLRLRSEWDRAEKPRKPTAAAVKALAESLLVTRRPAYVISPERMDAHLSMMRLSACHAVARTQAHGWYMREMAKLVNKLKSLPDVRRQILAHVALWCMEDAEAKVPDVIAHWLDQTCHQCHGLLFLPAVDAPVLSTKLCRACGGTGVAHAPHEQDGRRVVNYMDDCVSRARSALKKRLRAYRTQE